MKAYIGIAIDAALLGIFLGLTVLCTYVAAKGLGTVFAWEYGAYISLALFGVRIYRRALPRPVTTAPMIAGALISGVGYTAALWLLNGIWKWVTLRELFTWGQEITLRQQLAESLTYSVGLAEFRYPAACAAMALLCIAVSVLAARWRK